MTTYDASAGRRDTMPWGAPDFDLGTGLFVPQLVTWGSWDRRVHTRRGAEGICDVGGGGGGGEVLRQLEGPPRDE